jgi:EAL and modified HD-GYP domain-containing signal transduction protein
MTEPSSKDSNSVSIGRQPIFDKQRKLWGYELFCVGGPPNVAQQIQSSAYASLQQITQAGKSVLVDFTERGILNNLPYALPPKLAAIRVTERLGESTEVVDSLVRLKSDGYRVAVHGFRCRPGSASLYPVADIIGIDLNWDDRDTAAARTETARRYGALLMALRVQNETHFKTCRELEFDLFHGGFFKSPDRVTSRKLSSNEVVRFQLLQVMESAEFDVNRLANAIQSDVTITLRLLAYMNSAAFAFSQHIKSVAQAIALLGAHNVKNWLRVVLLSDMSQSANSRELVLLSAQRGLLLELIAKEHDFWGFAPDSLHLLGLFSLLDVLLGLPMPEIVTHLPLDYKMKAALCREPNNEYLPLLQLAQSFEEARWDDGERLIQELNLDGGSVKRAFQASLNWASTLASQNS